MKAIFYKLVRPGDKYSWWKREVEITSFEQFREECNSILWTKRSQRFCYLYDINYENNLEYALGKTCSDFLKTMILDDSYILIEKMYQMGEMERELDQKHKMGLLFKILHRIGIWFLKIKNFIIEFTKEGIGFYKELFVNIYFGLFKCK